LISLCYGPVARHGACPQKVGANDVDLSQRPKIREADSVDIAQSRWANASNLRRAEAYFEVEPGSFVALYDELLGDAGLIEAANAQLDRSRSLGFRRGIFGKPNVDSVDWFGFERILSYVLVRCFRPNVVWETGVYYGRNSLFLLRALQRNGVGQLTSAELPATDVVETADHPRHPWVMDSEDYDTSVIEPGCLVPPELHENWDLRLGSSLDLLATFPTPCDTYLHDSDHSMEFLLAELALLEGRLSERAIVVVDDIDWSNAFCVSQRLHPLLMTDNGKDDLRVRLGVAALSNPQNGNRSFT
jgi:hypothetical protein